jgi:hypothetical protein
MPGKGSVEVRVNYVKVHRHRCLQRLIDTFSTNLTGFCTFSTATSYATTGRNNSQKRVFPNLLCKTHIQTWEIKGTLHLTAAQDQS